MAETSPHVMIVEARFYEPLADELVRGAVRALEKAGATHERFAVPGAFEIPAAIAVAVAAQASPAGASPAGASPAGRRFDGYVALGCVIRGETTHYDYVCQESARGLQDLAIRHQLAVGYGILTVENEEQAWERAKLDRGDKGGDAVRACLAMIDLKRRFKLHGR